MSMHLVVLDLVLWLYLATSRVDGGVLLTTMTFTILTTQCVYTVNHSKGTSPWIQ